MADWMDQVPGAHRLVFDTISPAGKGAQTMKSTIFLIVGCVCGIAVGLTQAQVTKESVPGITNFARVETTVACAGATTPAALTEVKRLGYASVINLRQASEQGADIETEAAAAKAAGLTFVHLPFNAASPDPTLVDRFLTAVTERTNQPAFIYCASRNRAAALWFIKRVEVDKWDVDRASAEAAALGLTSPALKTFALDQIQARKR
jgi:uncharacterized protein (TIGR01244 family)